MERHLLALNNYFYAVGDCCSRYKCTHAAMAMRQLAARNALDPVAGSLLLAAWADATPNMNRDAALFLQEARWHTRSIKIASEPVSSVRRSASTAGTPVSA
jgi:hypothetical protein